MAAMAISVVGGMYRYDPLTADLPWNDRFWDAVSGALMRMLPLLSAGIGYFYGEEVLDWLGRCRRWGKQDPSREAAVQDGREKGESDARK